MKRVLKQLALLLLLYIAGECYRLLAYLTVSESASIWITVGYFIFTFVLTCILFYWKRYDKFGNRLRILLLFWVSAVVLDILMAALGVSRALQALFGIQDVGDLGGAATEMLKGSILFDAIWSAAAVSQLVLWLFNMRKSRKNRKASS